jgi:hypothetical protein
MKQMSSSLFGSLVTAGLMVAAAGRGTASPRTACDVLSLAEVRSLGIAASDAVYAGSRFAAPGK